MRSKSLVSVLVAVYNAEAYPEQPLSSVAAQTLADFEVIIPDDASGNASLEVATRRAD